jgi:SAM-dependent MidA family methyltransferase
VERLAGEDGMGTLFKVLAVLPADVEVPPFAGHRRSKKRGRG